jgi:hypothetical protein
MIIAIVVMAVALFSSVMVFAGLFYHSAPVFWIGMSGFILLSVAGIAAVGAGMVAAGGSVELKGVN